MTEQTPDQIDEAFHAEEIAIHEKLSDKVDTVRKYLDRLSMFKGQKVTVELNEPTQIEIAGAWIIEGMFVESRLERIGKKNTVRLLHWQAQASVVINNYPHAPDDIDYKDLGDPKRSVESALLEVITDMIRCEMDNIGEAMDYEKE